MGVSIYSFLLRNLGYRRTPQPVPLILIQRVVKGSKRQVEYRIKKMVDKGMIEKWTTKHPTHYKITYYRIPYHLKIRLEDKNNPLSIALDQNARIVRASDEDINIRQKNSDFNDSRV
jgi:hypothetical protein